jgi:serine/threonine protein kinase
VKQVGRYQIVEELGRGAMGVVYKALDPAIGRTVAIKTIRLSDLTDPEERRRVHERLLREAQAAGVLSHPNIVTIYDVLEEEDFAYVFMEYVNGSSLERMLRARNLPDRTDLLNYLRQVAAALDYAHRKGIIHRDIKPANVIIAERTPGAERMAKIADFGVAKFVSHEMTHSGSMIGTPSYMSPEQIQGMNIDGSSDQFSLAVLVYELLCGEKPFSGDSLPALFYAICKQEPKPVDQANPALSPTVSKVLARALSKSPKARFPSCGDFIGAFAIAIDASPAWRPVSAVLPETKLPGPKHGDGLAPTTPVIVKAAPIAAATVSDLPAARSRREEEPETTGQRSILGRIAALVAVCLAIAGLIVFIVRLNSGPRVPAQVLDSNRGPVTPPPQSAQPPSNAARSATSAPTPTEAPPQSAPEQSVPQNSQPTPSPAPQTSPPPEGIADIELLSEPPGAKIVVDSRSDASCTAPCTMSLPNGRHTLAAELNGYNTARRIFLIPGDPTLFIPMTRSTGVLFVNSMPPGATIYIDDMPYGRTPATLHLPPGSHHVIVSSGSIQREDTVVLQNDGFEARTFRLQ